MVEKKDIKAVALKYESEKMKAPAVVAKGRGNIAERIIEIAKKSNVYIYNDPDLADILYKLDLFAEIPPHLYTIIAEIFAFLYRINKMRKEKDETLQDNDNR